MATSCVQRRGRSSILRLLAVHTKLHRVLQAAAFRVHWASSRSAKLYYQVLMSDECLIQARLLLES